jgi:hypothetical protein
MAINALGRLPDLRTSPLSSGKYGWLNSLEAERKGRLLVVLASTVDGAGRHRGAGRRVKSVDLRRKLASLFRNN